MSGPAATTGAGGGGTTASVDGGAVGASTTATTTTATTAQQPPNEEDLRKQLRLLMQGLKKREPLDTTYKRLLTNGIVTTRRPALPKEKFYRRVGSRLRETVEQFLMENQGKDPFDRIAQRQPLEEEKMRAAFTLREFKEHEQQPLLNATLASLPKRQGVDELSRRRYLEGVAQGLQTSKKPSRRNFGSFAAVPLSASEQTEKARQAATLEHQRKEARERELARQKREEEDRKRREAENSRRKNTIETPQQALHKFYHPIFKILWDMEFAYLGNTNPFRIVIDRDNCASIGAPDYFEVVQTPMNLTWIQRKVEAMSYETLSAFFQDVDLMLQNALTYNSDPKNPYRIAAEEMQKKYKRVAKRVIQTIQKKHATR